MFGGQCSSDALMLQRNARTPRDFRRNRRRCRSCQRPNTVWAYCGIFIHLLVWILHLGIGNKHDKVSPCRTDFVLKSEIPAGTKRLWHFFNPFCSLCEVSHTWQDKAPTRLPSVPPLSLLHICPYRSFPAWQVVINEGFHSAPCRWCHTQTDREAARLRHFNTNPTLLSVFKKTSPDWCVSVLSLIVIRNQNVSGNACLWTRITSSGGEPQTCGVLNSPPTYLQNKTTKVARRETVWCWYENNQIRVKSFFFSRFISYAVFPLIFFLSSVLIKWE